MSDNGTMVTMETTPEALLGQLTDVERKHAPRELFLAGDQRLLTAGARVSIVGSRKASREGLARAAKLAALLVERGIIVVSGLAEGVDTAAHTTAMECGGRTVAVLGTALTEYYPAQNRALQDRIMREHLAVSQFAPGRAPGARAFPMRNRTMALLSDATVIVEAGPRSGTIHQGWEALRLGRSLYLMESLARTEHRWVKELQEYGALVLSEATKELFLESLPEESRAERTEATF